MTNEAENRQPPSIDDFIAEASRYTGKKILAGITYKSANGDVLSQKQFHGTVVSVGQHGLTIQLEGAKAGETFTLPPDLRGIREIPPQIFTLRETGETVEDPDLLADFTVISPEND